MPLVLTLRPQQDFYVGDAQFVVTEVHGDRSFKIHAPSVGRSFDINDAHGTEVLPDVFVSAGRSEAPRGARTAAVVLIDAPTDILVVRGEKRRNPPNGVKHRSCQ